MDSDSFRTYAARLEAERERALTDILAAMDATLETRRGFFLDEGFAPPVGTTYPAGGKRFAVVAALDDTTPPEITLAVAGDGTLHRVEPEIRAHRVELRVCRPVDGSVSAVGGCATGRGTRVRVRHLAIELSAGERLGDTVAPPLEVWQAVEVEVAPPFLGCKPVP